MTLAIGLALIIYLTIFSISYADIALDLLLYYPELTLAKDFYGKSPLYAAAGAPSLFRRHRSRIWHGICDR